jgi:hypothetical protein
MANPFDTSNAPLTEPESIVSGTFVAWRIEDDIDDTLFGLQYKFTSLADASVQVVTGVSDGDGLWSFTLPGATTSSWGSGDYIWDRQYTRVADTEVAPSGSGSVRVFESTDDRRSHAVVMLRKIESLLNGRSDSDVESYSIKSRSITKMSTTELMKWREYYRAEVGAEESAAAGGNSNTIRVRWS